MDMLWFKARRVISVLLVFAMLASITPVQVFAEDDLSSAVPAGETVQEDNAPSVEEDTAQASSEATDTETTDVQENEETVSQDEVQSEVTEGEAVEAPEETPSDVTSENDASLPENVAADTAEKEAGASSDAAQPAEDETAASTEGEQSSEVANDQEQAATEPEEVTDEGAAVSLQTLTATVGNATVSVEAELPAGIQVSMTAVAEEELSDADLQTLTAAVQNGTISALEAYDISLVDAEGNVYALQEGQTANVTLTGIALQAAEGEELYAAHLKADGSADMGEIDEAGNVSFAVNSFSPFVVASVGSGETAASEEDAVEEGPAAAPEENSEPAGVAAYSALADTYASKKNYFTNSTTDPHVHIYYSVNGKDIQEIASGETISLPEITYNTARDGIVGIEFYIAIDKEFEYGQTTFTGTQAGDVFDIDHNSVRELSAIFGRYKVDFSRAINAAKELGATHAFFYQDNGLSGNKVGSRTFAVSTNVHAKFAVVNYHNTKTNELQTFYLEKGLSTTTWSGVNGEVIDWTDGGDNTHLVGWSKTANGPLEYGLSQAFIPTEDLELYTVWEKNTVTVTYDPNGGSWSGPTTETPAKGEAYHVSNLEPTRYGYEFQGWQIDGEGTLYKKNAEIPANLMGQDIKLVASWKNTQKYTVAVTLSTASGTELKSTTKDDVSWETLNDYKSMDGYALANALLETSFDSNSGVNAAQWSPENLSEGNLNYEVEITISDDSADLVTVTYNGNGAAGSVPAAAILIKGEPYTVASARGLSKTGHTFGGWMNGSDIYNADDGSEENDTIAAVQEDITLTAQWTPNMYTVTWMNQDGTRTLGTTSVEYGNKPVYKGETPTKDSTDGEEFLFAGWSADKNQMQGTSEENLAQVTGDVTYYAAFSAQTRRYPYTIQRVYRTTDSGSVTEVQSSGQADYNKQLSELVGAPQPSVQYNGAYYLYSGNDAEGKVIGTGSNVITLYYDIDTLVDVTLDSDDNPNNGDGIADKYQMTVTYQVQNGSWNDDTTQDKTEVVTLMSGGVYNENGTATLDQVPAVGEKPNAGMYGDDECWEGGAKPITATRDDSQFVYTYRELNDVIITFDDENLTYNGEVQEGKATFTSNLSTSRYTVKVNGYQAPTGKDVKDGGYQGDVEKATATITDNETGADVTYRYAISYVAGTLNIEPKLVTVSLQAKGKTYDGTQAVKDYTLIVNETVNGETLAATAGQVVFDSADAGTRQVTATGIAISDPNYILSETTATTSATIEPKPLNVTVSFEERVYAEGNTTVQVKDAVIADGQIVEGDKVEATASGTGTITSDLVQNGAVVSSNVQPVLSGADSSNYTLGNVSYAPVNILGVVSYDTNAGDDEVTWTAPQEERYHHNDPVTPTTEKPGRYGYAFMGWSVNAAAEEPDESFVMGDTGLKLYAVWQAQDVTVTVNYHYGENDPVAENLPGKKFDETLVIGMGTGEYELTLNAKTTYQGAAYTLSSVDMGKQNLFTLNAENYMNPTFTYSADLNKLTVVIDVYYMADEGGDGIPDQYQVTVNYAVAKGAWNDGTDASKSEKVTLLNNDGQWDENGSGTLSDVPEVGEKADVGYTAGSWNDDLQKVVIYRDDQGKVFTYTYAVDANQQYKVTYTAQANGSVSPASEKAQVLSTADLKGAAAAPANGYVFDGWYKGDSKISSDAVLSAEIVAANLEKTTNAHGETVYKDTEFSARFAIRTDLSYTVRYLEDGTARELASPKTVGGQTYGATVTETAINIGGYTLTSDKNPQSITIGTGENVITFYYREVGPDVEPTPTPTETPTVPVTPPTTPTTPAGGGTTTATPAPAEEEEVTEEPAEEEVIEEEETPLAEEPAEEETIGDEETPLAGGSTTWGLLNLILAILTVLGSALLLIGYLGKKRKEDEEGEEEYTVKKNGFWRVISLIPAIAAVIAFILTEDMSLPMAFVDRWTLLMVIIAVIQIVVAVLSMKEKQEPEEE